jgi:hypothetical protein
MRRLIPSAFITVGLLGAGAGTCQVVKAQVQPETNPYTTNQFTDNRPYYPDQRTYRGGSYGGWGLLGLCGLFGLLGARRSRTYDTTRVDTTGRVTERTWEPRPTH